MRRASVVIAAMLLAGCTSTSTTAQPSATVRSSVPSSVPGQAPSSGGQKPVPAENNPPGAIPDNIAFVTYANPAGAYRFTHPEGWTEKTRGETVTFTDKLNGVQAWTATSTGAPTRATAQATDIPSLTGSQAAFELRGITEVTEPAGKGVRIVYRRNSAPDPVTGRQYRDEVERYELVAGGREVIMELFGPVGADNVDAYRTMITSLRLG